MYSGLYCAVRGWGEVLATVSRSRVTGLLVGRLSTVFFISSPRGCLVRSRLGRMLLHYRLYFSEGVGGCCSLGKRACFDPFRSTRCAVFLCCFSGRVFEAKVYHLLTSGLCCLGGVVGTYSLFCRVRLPSCFRLSRPMNDMVKETGCKSNFVFSRGYAIKGGHNVCPIVKGGIEVYTGSSVVNGYLVNSGIVVNTGSKIGSRSVPGSDLMFNCSPGLIMGEVEW